MKGYILSLGKCVSSVTKWYFLKPQRYKDKDTNTVDHSGTQGAGNISFLELNLKPH